MKRKRFLLRETGNSKMRKVFLFLAAVAVCFCMAGEARAQVVAAGTTGGCIWELTETSGDYTLMISGNGAMGDYDYNSSPWYSYQSDIKTVDIQQGVMSIGNYAFYNCSSLTSVLIPNSVTSIGNDAFSYCSTLTSVTIPDLVTSIGSYAFRNCSGLTSVTIPDLVTSIGSYAFSYCSGLISVTIPDLVTSIGNYAFYHCSALTSVTIPDLVTAIGSSAFSGCTGLTSVTIPDLVTSIESFAFYGCSGLTSITIPSSVESIGSYAFDGCSGLTSVTIPDLVTSIGNSAFSYCSRLTSVTIPSSVELIGNSAFYGCSRLTSVTIPHSVTSIGSSAFYGCTGLTAINVDESNTRFSSNNGVLFNKDQTALICSPAGKTGNYTIPHSVMSIESNAFYGCRGLTSVTIPDLVTSIESFAFYGCSGLTSVTIPNSVESIGSSAFDGCTGLTSITIPDLVTSIGSSAFYGCTGLISITIPDLVTSIGSSAFYGCTGLTSVTIPDLATSIGYNAFSGCDKLATITGGNGLSRIGSRAFHETQWYNEKDDNSEVYIGTVFYSYKWKYEDIDLDNPLSVSIKVAEGTLGIADGALGSDDGSYFNPLIRSVTLPGSLTHIGEGAFRYCSNLSSITLPPNLQFIGMYAFASCNSLLAVYSEAVTAPTLGSTYYTFNTRSEAAPAGQTLYLKPNATGYESSKGWPALQVREDAAIKLVAQPLPFYGGLIAGSLEYNYGDNAALTAESSSGYVFQHWMEDNTIVGMSATYTFAVTAPRTLYAVFAPRENENSVTVAPQPTEVSMEWESEAGAGSYTLVIYIDAARTQIHITLRFDSNGTLQPVGVVNFSPAQRSAQNRLSYTVDGLQAGKEYYYSLTSYNAEEYALTTAVGSFETAIALGIESVESRGIRIYPNPVRESFRIAGLTAPTPVTVTNTAGQTVGQQIVSGDESISVRHLPQGVYLVRANGKTEKIIKN